MIIARRIYTGVSWGPSRPVIPPTLSRPNLYPGPYPRNRIILNSFILPSPEHPLKYDAPCPAHPMQDTQPMQPSSM